MKDIETDLARSGGELLLGFMENHKKDLSRWIRQGVDNVRVSLGFYLREKRWKETIRSSFWISSLKKHSAPSNRTK